MAVENYNNVTKLDQKMMRWRPPKIGESKTKTLELLSPQEIARLIDELTLNSIALATQREELEKTQQELRNLQNQYNDIYEYAPVGYATLDRSGLITEVNLTTLSMLKIEKQLLIGGNLVDFITPDSRESFYSLLDRIFETKSVQIGNIIMRGQDGSVFASRIEGIYVNNSISTEPIPLCRLALVQSANDSDRRNAIVVPISGQEIESQGCELTRSKIPEPDNLGAISSVNTELQDTLNTTAKMVEMRDFYSVGHQQKVSRLAIALARELGLAEENIKHIGVAGLVHDIGKINIPAELLAKRGKLSEADLKKIKDHVIYGHDILKKMSFPSMVATIVLQHHERIDGSGYPLGIKGDDILLESRILAVADSLEAMCSQRAYRPSLGIEEALQELSINKGILYDSAVVQACLKIFKQQKFNYD